jgi:hypothetical protein
MSTSEAYEPFLVPDEHELVEFFGLAAAERAPDDGYWIYEIIDSRGIALRFSFDLYEKYVQTVFSMGNAAIATVAHEGAVCMSIAGSALTVDFKYKGAKSRLTLRVGASVEAEWSSLRTE